MELEKMAGFVELLRLFSSHVLRLLRDLVLLNQRQWIGNQRFGSAAN